MRSLWDTIFLFQPATDDLPGNHDVLWFDDSEEEVPKLQVSCALITASHFILTALIL